MKQMHNLQDAYNLMRNDGVTHKKLRDEYHLTEWGARKFVDTLATDSKEIDGRGKKLYSTDKPFEELTREERHTSIPVSLNHSENVREKQHSKSQTTEKAKNYITDIEKMVKEVDAPDIEWEEQHYNTQRGVDIIWHETDTHIGALVENEYGETVFDTETAKNRLRTKALEFQDYAITKDVDTIHWLLGGDHVEGTGIYDGQGHEVEGNINYQLNNASEAFIEAAKVMVHLADENDAKLQVICVPGNHGDLRVKGSSNQANFDDILFHTLALALDSYLESQPDEVSDRVRVKRSDTSVGVTFPVREYVGYLTHGQNMKEHVGTSSGKRDALSIKDNKGCDAIFRGHYHMSKLEEVNTMPVVMTPSMKPGGQYEDSMQAYSDPGYAFYTATDEDIVAEVKRGRF